MRLHDLSITAFGPFVDTVHVDFDDLASSGLFLLTGDTGAGKTSVLDAVCFALYGEVPGDRHSARHLRSDHADATAEPRVVLRVSIAGRMFRFTRSPAWERPKRRGSGSTRVQAHVVIEEQCGRDWRTLTNRLDEAGQLVSGLLGMTCSQFTQVAMLPQGRFQALLRASSAERHAVLQRLFRTHRFEEVERWLVERRTLLRRACQTHQDDTAGVVNRLQEAAGSAAPEEWDLHDLDRVADDGSLERWAARLTGEASLELDQRRAGLEAATAAFDRDSAALERGRTLAGARTRGLAARTRLAELAEAGDLEQELVSSLDAHRRAAPVLPLAMRVEGVAAQAAEARARAARHVESVLELLDAPADQVGLTMLTTAATRVREERAVAESWLPREQQLHAERTRLRELEIEVGRLDTTVAAAERRSHELRDARGLLDRAFADATPAAERAADDRAAVQAAERGLEAAAEVVELETALVDARERLVEVTALVQDLRDGYLDLRERRISGMAAELAGGLAVGCSCPVCGSIEHPSLATGSARVGREDEEAARGRHESADFERQAVQESVTTLDTRLEVARLRSEGLTTAAWRESLTAAATAAAESAAAHQRLTRLREELAALDREEKPLVAQLATARATLEQREHEQVEVRERLDSLSLELETLLSGRAGITTVAALVEAHRRATTDLEEAQSALARSERAGHELLTATRASEDAATEAGFSSLGDALAAVLPGSEAVGRAHQLEQRRAARAAATTVLEEASVLAALEADRPDLELLAATLAESSASRDRGHAAHAQARTRADRLASLGEDLADALAAWAPERDRHALTAGLASLVEGKSADNQLKMRLSAYVLSERLRQVVAAANERLGAMTDQRFVLEHADEKGAGEQRGGLSLRVLDEWSGKHRDPATLSGGETFIVSLALALGLADTVSHEAGGTQLDTLFIDEGFGALDATTLDGVMDTLDELRDGGRVVGLVSHVAELRNRVPAQLEVRKARRGSTLRAAVADG